MHIMERNALDRRVLVGVLHHLLGDGALQVVVGVRADGERRLCGENRYGNDANEKQFLHDALLLKGEFHYWDS